MVDCKHVGTGDKALVYLGRYLYRGVLPEKHIVRCEASQVTFRYTDNQGLRRTRTLAGADFLWLLLHHVLLKGFRRSRDYGFLHGNRKQLISLLHLVLRFSPPKPPVRPPLCCRHCGGRITVTIFPFILPMEGAQTLHEGAAMETAM